MRYTQFLFFVLLNLSAQFGLITHAIAAENTKLADTGLAGISLDEATALALQANPDIAIALSGREVESGQALQAGTRPNPTLSAQIEDLRSRNRNTILLIANS